MDRESFRQRLAAGAPPPRWGDGHGAARAGIPIDECFDALNISQPAIVADIHRDYIAAGADMLETNSFGANRFKLAEHGLEAQVRAINTAAVEVALRVIAGSYRPVLLAGVGWPSGGAAGASRTGQPGTGDRGLCRADRRACPSRRRRRRRRPAGDRDAERSKTRWKQRCARHGRWRRTCRWSRRSPLRATT
jgi:hypothetical protein